MKKLKDQTFTEYVIKIRRTREVEKRNSSCSYKDKMFLVDIKSYGGGISFGVKASSHYGRDLRKVFREIQEHLHLK